MERHVYGPTFIRDICEWKNDDFTEKSWRHRCIFKLLYDVILLERVLLSLTNVPDECRTAVIVKGSIKNNSVETHVTLPMVNFSNIRAYGFLYDHVDNQSQSENVTKPLIITCILHDVSPRDTGISHRLTFKQK